MQKGRSVRRLSLGETKGLWVHTSVWASGCTPHASDAQPPSAAGPASVSRGLCAARPAGWARVRRQPPLRLVSLCHTVYRFWWLMCCTASTDTMRMKTIMPTTISTDHHCQEER